MPPTNNGAAPVIRSLSQVIGMIDRGAFQKSADEALREAIESVRAQPGEKGKATITLEMEVAVQGEMIQFKPKLKCKLPDGQSFAPLVLWDHDGGLTAQHPSQMGMFEDVNDDRASRGGTAVG
jgi:hypothetical protein